MAIYSKFPIINKGSLDLKDTANNIIFADILEKKIPLEFIIYTYNLLRIKPDKANFGEEDSEKLIARFKESF